MGPWRFQIVRAALAETDNDWAEWWLYAYAPPAGAAQVLQIVDVGGCRQEFRYEGNKLYTNTPEARIDYVSNDPGTLATIARARFRGALIALLASRICMSVTKSSKREKELITIAETAISRAQAANHNERDNTYGDHMPDILKARMGGYPDGRRVEGPEVVYPDFDPVGTFESELG